MERMRIMERGIIKSWNDDRGFGFIGRPGKIDVFFHISNIQSDGWRPQKGDNVVFEAEKDGLGRMRATTVQFVPYGG